MLLIIGNRAFLSRPLAAELAAGKPVAFAGPFGKPYLRLFLQILHQAEQRRTGRTHVTASRQLPFRLQVRAKLALLDLPEGTVVFEFGHGKRACIDAVTTADTPVRMMLDDAGLRILGHGRHRARRNTGGIYAMQTVPLDERIAVNLPVL